jgi:hypothetical protein
MALNISRQGRVYGKLEAAGYGTLQTLAGANALRHVDLSFNYDPFNRVDSPEKKTGPGLATRFDRRTSAGLAGLTALLRPSGLLNTFPEASFLLEAAFGSKTNVTLATTILSGALVGGCTLTAAGTLAVGDGVLLIDNTTGLKHVRRLLSVAGAAVTWAPDLPNAPINGSAVKGGISYKLVTDMGSALAFVLLHVLPGFRRELRGIGADKIAVMFDANEEPRVTVSGPAQQQLSDAAAIADPGTFTTVGGNPPSGRVGDLYIGTSGVAYLFRKFSFEFTNALMIRNQEYGVNLGTELYRKDRRAVTCKLDAFVETAAKLYDVAKAGTFSTASGVFKQTGRTEGNIVAVALPKVDWKVPDTSDGDTEAEWSFSGVAAESADAANDECAMFLF